MNRSILLEVLDRPEDIGHDEYRVIHAYLQQLAHDVKGPGPALEALISACDQFVGWADHAKNQLMDMRPARKRPAAARPGRRGLRLRRTRSA